MSTRSTEAPLWHRFVAGAAGECFAVCFSHPADVLKVRLQLTGECNSAKKTLTIRDLFAAARQLVVKEGLRNGLYSGISASWMRQCVFSGLRHGGYGVLERRWSETYGNSSLFGKLSCAISSGGIAAMIANPADVVLIRMQSDGHWPESQRRQYRHGLDGLRRVVRDEGVATLWRGCSPTVLRAMLVTTSQICTYEEVKEGLRSAGYSDGVGVHMVSAMSSATVACIATSPVDVVKTRIINMQRTHGVSYSGPADVVLKTIRTEGPLAFYKGLSATFLRLWPHTVLLWLGQEQVSHQLRKMNFGK